MMMNNIFTNHGVASLGKTADAFAHRHPLFGFFAIVIGMPIVILLALVICTSAIVLPITWIISLL